MSYFEEYEKIIFGEASFKDKLTKLKDLINKGEKIQAYKALTMFSSSKLNEEERNILTNEIKNILNEKEIIDYILNDPVTIFSLPEGEIFKNFVDKYYKELKEYFQNHLIYQMSSITDDLNDEPSPLYYKRDFNYWDNQNDFPEITRLNCAILPVRRDSFNCYYFYKTFHDVINLCTTNVDHNSIFTSIEFTKLLELFKEEYQYKNYNSYLIFQELMSRSKKNNYIYNGPIDLTIFKEIYKSYHNGYNIPNIDFFTKQIFSMLDSSKEVSKEFNLISYLANIKYLRSIPKKERRKNKTYQDLFNQYKAYFQNELKNSYPSNKYIQISKEDEKILELVFERSINQDNVLKTLKINSLEKLYFFFKTNYLDISYVVDLEKIKSFNVKHFFRLKEKMNIPLFENNTTITENIFDTNIYQKLTDEEIINLLYIYDYDFLNDLINENGIKKEIYTILKEINPEKMKNNNYKALIYHIIKDLNKLDISIAKKVKESPDIVLRIIDFMIYHKYPKITLDKILKRINCVSYLLLPNNYQLAEELAKLDLVAKGDPFLEKIEAISLYDIYRSRIFSSIPEIKGYVGILEYSLVDMHDKAIISNGIGKYIYPNNVFASSCLTPNGKASSCLVHGATNPNGRFLQITKDGNIVGYSWLWRQGELLCLDNLELTEEYLNIPNNESTIYKILIAVANSFIEQTKNDENPIKLVVLGRNKIDVKNKYLDTLKCVRDFKEENFRPQNHGKLYLKDSEDKQIILAGEVENIDLSDIKPIYKYIRKPVVSFNSLNKNELEKKINSIYFDNCLKANIKYYPKKESYIDGYLGEDWFMGIKDDGTEEIYTRRDDQDIIEEIQKTTHKNYEFTTNIFVPKTEEKEKLKWLCDYNNYIINEQAIKDYLKYISSLKSLEPISDYFHSPRSSERLLSIFVDHAITSNYLGKRNNIGGSNGTHFICLAKIPSYLYETYSNFPGFGFKDNLCILKTDNKNDFFRYTQYPFRSSGDEDEYQVKDLLSLDKANAVIVPCSNYELVSIIPIIQEYTDNNLPMYNNTNFQELDKYIIKKYVKLK